MTVPLYMDEHVHRAITVGLRLRGVDVLTAQEDGRDGVSDSGLLDRATELERPLFTQDDDLLAKAQQRQTSAVPFSGVIYCHQLHMTVGECIRDLELIAKAASKEDLLNRVEFLPL